jgi:hypothetical protein
LASISKMGVSSGSPAKAVRNDGPAHCPHLP